MKHYSTRLQTILSIMLITLFIPSELKSQNDTEYEKLLREYLMENDSKTILNWRLIPLLQRIR